VDKPSSVQQFVNRQQLPLLYEKTGACYQVLQQAGRLAG